MKRHQPYAPTMIRPGQRWPRRNPHRLRTFASEFRDCMDHLARQREFAADVASQRKFAKSILGGLTERRRMRMSDAELVDYVCRKLEIYRAK